MAKQPTLRYRCAACSYLSLTPVGRCPSCGAWGTLEPEETAPVRLPSPSRGRSKPIALPDAPPETRVSSGLEELDRVLGGGWLAGGVVLLGGEPGVGKSTLLLQSCCAMAEEGQRVLYVSGEESASQLALRARRLGLETRNLSLLSTDDVTEALEEADPYAFVVFDSVQALKDPESTGWPGSPHQVRSVAERVLAFSKGRRVPTVLVGHITKQGQIAGPKLLEHLVDVVLLFWGEKSSRNRLLRAEKNRFGSTDELGAFEMGERGLSPLLDPSHLYWNGEESGVPGVALGVVLEGSRPLLTEVQALSCPSPFPYPKRTARGIEMNRLQLLLAVLERRCGLSSRTGDVYLNVAGGLVVQDPAADLAVCLALAGALRDLSLDGKTCFVGEVGLAGEVRPVARTLARLKEAARFGFRRAFVSRRGLDRGETYPLEVVPVSSLSEVVRAVFP